MTLSLFYSRCLSPCCSASAASASYCSPAVWIGLGLANCILLGFRATPLTAPDIWLLSSVRDIIEIYMSQPVLILLMLGIAALIGVIVLLWLRAKKTRPS